MVSEVLVGDSGKMSGEFTNLVNAELVLRKSRNGVLHLVSKRRMTIDDQLKITCVRVLDLLERYHACVDECIRESVACNEHLLRNACRRWVGVRTGEGVTNLSRSAVW